MSLGRAAPPSPPRSTALSSKRFASPLALSGLPCPPTSPRTAVASVAARPSTTRSARSSRSTERRCADGEQGAHGLRAPPRLAPSPDRMRWGGQPDRRPRAPRASLTCCAAAPRAGATACRSSGDAAVPEWRPRAATALAHGLQMAANRAPGARGAAGPPALACDPDGEPFGRAPSRRDDVPQLVRCGGGGEAGGGGAAVQTCTI